MSRWSENFMLLDDIRFSQASLCAALPALTVTPDALLPNAMKIDDIGLDSRQVNEKKAFIALAGSQSDGFHYIDNAIENASPLVFCEREPSAELKQKACMLGASIVTVDGLAEKLPAFLSVLYAPLNTTPSITAVTGTNGKTSVAFLYAQLSLATRQRSASLGTLGLNIVSVNNLSSKTNFKKDSFQADASHQAQLAAKVDAPRFINEHFELGVNTTCDIVSHYKLLRLLAQQHVENYCLEASSHGLEQKRLAGLPIRSAIFTNLTQDHLDYHGSMAQYAQAKRGLLLFSSLNHLVLNADDAESSNWANALAARDLAQASKVQTLWYGLQKSSLPANAQHYCIAQNIHCTPGGIEFTIDSSFGSAKVKAPLLGEFNVLNILAAFGAHLLQGADFEALSAQISQLEGVPGRMELFKPSAVNASLGHKTHGNFIVDYAHTPDALAQSLKAARRHTRGKLLCVFGCGGDRDKTKRPVMGAAAAKHADILVLTQDNSRTEQPQTIVNEIMTGIPNDAKVHVELDREQAVKWAWKCSGADDLVLLAGKGHETYLEINNQRLAYDERALVQRICAEAAL
ncbi:Mur ligase family protein [Glaciecola siphonariae]|uniref:UDP-N-acetylmuramyl-tripeptide synthetase n=1 Tax=Glaciecola siphonariae TaxID=521012 RepID=A0ABV9LXW7_9ALTE